MQQPTQRFEPMESCHAFDMHEILLCEEAVYVSDLPVERDSSGDPVKTNFSLQNPHNRGTVFISIFYPSFLVCSLTIISRPDIKVAGYVKDDLSYLRDQGRIQPVSPRSNDDGVVRGKMHWEIKYDVVFVVEGRNLSYDLVFPSGPGGKVLKTGKISIASAFFPGTS